MQLKYFYLIIIIAYAFSTGIKYLNLRSKVYVKLYIIREWRDDCESYLAQYLWGRCKNG